MKFREYIIRNRDNEAWLIQVIAGKGSERIYQYKPDLKAAMRFKTLSDARRMARDCRGRVQAVRYDKDRNEYAEDVGA